MPRTPASTSVPCWRRLIVQYISGKPRRPLKARALARALDVPPGQYARFAALVRDMLAAGELVLGRGRTLALPEQAGVTVGVFRAHRRGFGFLECPDRPDLYVPRGKVHAARDGDTVEARLLAPGPRGAGPRAAVIRVIERAPLRWVGLLVRAGQRWIVRPQGREPAPDVRVEDPGAKSAREGDLVVVEPLEHTLGSACPRGVILERLGPQRQTQVKIRAVIRRYDLPEEFSARVRRAAQRAAARLTPQALRERLDLRRLPTITIDPPDARDFDDAISVEPLDHDRVRLGVHIADVAYFVRPGGPLDGEARLRGNSAYFPGRVVPMLPETLSNGVCSLQPGEPRLTKSVLLTYDRRARLVQTRFADSVIRSRARLTYAQVTEALDGAAGGLDEQTLALLRRAEKLARRLLARRREQGMIVLTLPEVEVRLDADGQVADAGPADTSFSHTIIEMFMLAANEAVCRLLTSQRVPLLRRIHPPPDPKASQEYARLLRSLDPRLPRGLDRQSICASLEAVRGRPEQAAVNYLLLRSLPQATYSPAAEGHFALAIEHYCHFTSPIRRYPDLVNQRLLNVYLHRTARGTPGHHADQPPSEFDLVELGRHASATERRAEQAERAAVKLLLLDLMKRKLGQTLSGIITGVLPFGLFVQVQPYMAEGIVRVADFGGDGWVYDRSRGAFLARRGRRVLRLGQRVRVVVAAVNELREELVLVPAADGLLASG